MLTYYIHLSTAIANFLFQGNPTVSVIAFFAPAGLAFNQSYALHHAGKNGVRCSATARTKYCYYVLFASVSGRDSKLRLEGITIQMHQTTEITMQLSGAAHALNNMVKEPITQQYYI